MATTENYRPSSIIHHKHSPRTWRLKRNGLNIEGLCTNIQCQAYNQMVVINLGIGEFDFARIILERKNKCPKCNNKIHPTKYALLRCQWRFVNHYSTYEFNLNTVHNTYELKDLICEYLIIETMTLPKQNRLIDYSSIKDLTCSICLNNIDTNNNNETSYLQCSHIFHLTCIDQWLQSKECMAHKCPLCRGYITDIY